MALEGGLTTAILAGLRGFHRGEFERRGTWDEVLARTTSDAGEPGCAGRVSARRPSASARRATSAYAAPNTPEVTTCPLEP